MSQNQNQSQANNDNQDDKVFARAVTVRDTKSGGSILTMFIGVEEAAKIYEDLGIALQMTDKGEAEGATLSVVTGEGRNGKPYALIGARPLYPSKTEAQGGKPAYQPRQNSGGYQPRGGSARTQAAPQAQGANTSRGFNNRKLG